MEWLAVVNGHGLSLAILLSSSVAMCTYEGNGNQEHISKSLVHKDYTGCVCECVAILYRHLVGMASIVLSVGVPESFGL
jgi:hypothetical protein